MSADDKETMYARGRLVDITYLSKSFPYPNKNSDDSGEPSRYVVRVVDSDTKQSISFDAEGSVYVARESPGGRKQIKVLVAKEARNIKDLWIYDVPTSDEEKLEQCLHLHGDDAARLAAMFRDVDQLALEPDLIKERRFDSDFVESIAGDEATIQEVYRNNPEMMRTVVSNDVTSEDIYAIAARKEAAREFEDNLNSQMTEAEWQEFFERNPWMLGAALSNHLFISWSTRLQKQTAGQNMEHRAKVPDAVLKTEGAINNLVLVELKRPDTDLLAATSYRAETWLPSKELSGAISQMHTTAHLTKQDNPSCLPIKSSDESIIPGKFTYLFKPKCFVILGNASKEFTSPETGGPFIDKIRSFELLRQNTTGLEIITFDELLVKVKWLANSLDNNQ